MQRKHDFACNVPKSMFPFTNINIYKLSLTVNPVINGLVMIMT